MPNPGQSNSFSGQAAELGGKRKMAWKLSPELSDGVNPTILKRKDTAVVLELVEEWLKEALFYSPGESCSIEVVAMTDAEVDALPDL